MFLLPLLPLGWIATSNPRAVRRLALRHPPPPLASVSDAADLSDAADSSVEALAQALALAEAEVAVVAPPLMPPPPPPPSPSPSPPPSPSPSASASASASPLPSPSPSPKSPPRAVSAVSTDTANGACSPVEALAQALAVAEAEVIAPPLTPPPPPPPPPLPPPPPVSTVYGPRPIVVHEAPTYRVLLIYTGGTLGMVKDEGSWSAPTHHQGGLPDLMQAMPEFADDSMPDIDFMEFSPLLDSSNMGPNEWCSLATQVGEHYFDYDGFVIIHGTDTISYTASALSFMLEGLGKAVVLTGSIIPMCEPFNDARRNLIASIMFASQLELSEVSIFFNDRLIRGNRAVKVDTHSLAALDSPNFPPLATAGADGITAANRHLWRPPPVCRLRVHTNLEARVIVLRLTPGFDDSAIAAVTRSPDLAAIVLSLYGTGNGPSHKAGFMQTVSEAIERGLLVVALTQCHRGSVELSTYEVGRRLMQIGVVSGGDMTTEACVTKVSYLCGRGLTGQRLRDAMAMDLRGELTPQEASDHISLNREKRL